MLKVTYHEYRPGRWVKMVDGEAVGPATAEEVARWQEEKAEQARIWHDVVRGTTPAPSPDQPAEAGGPKRGTARTDEVGIWQDVVGQAVDAPAVSAAPQAGAKPGPPTPQTVEDAVRSARRGRPVEVKGGRVVLSEEGRRSDAASVASTPTTEAGVVPSGPAQSNEKPAQPIRGLGREAPVRKRTATPEAVPEPEGEDVAPVVEPVMPKGELPPTKVRRRRRKEPEVVDESAGLEAAPPAKGASAAKPRPARRRARTTRPGKPVQVEAAPVTAVPEADEFGSAEPALAEEQPAAEPVPTAGPTSIEKAVKLKSSRPRKLSKEAAKTDLVPTAGKLPADETAADSLQPEHVAEVIPSPEIRRAGPSSALHRRPKTPPSPSQVDLSPAYLWVMSDATDNIAAAVRTGLARYEERFSEPAGVVLCHLDDLPVVEAAGLPVEAREGKGVLPRNFWIGPK